MKRETLIAVMIALSIGVAGCTGSIPADSDGPMGDEDAIGLDTWSIDDLENPDGGKTGEEAGEQFKVTGPSKDVVLTVGEEFELKLKVTGGSGNIYWYDPEPELPAGLVFKRGKISGTPTEAFEDRVTFEAEDEDTGESAAVAFDITVLEPGSNVVGGHFGPIINPSGQDLNANPPAAVIVPKKVVSTLAKPMDGVPAVASERIIGFAVHMTTGGVVGGAKRDHDLYFKYKKGDKWEDRVLPIEGEYGTEGRYGYYDKENDLINHTFLVGGIDMPLEDSRDYIIHTPKSDDDPWMLDAVKVEIVIETTYVDGRKLTRAEKDYNKSSLDMWLGDGVYDFRFSSI